MSWSKASKVWAAGVGAGLLTVVGGALLVTGVGSGAGAVLITSGLATIGGVVGGGMLAGVGVIAAGSATAAALAAAIADKAIQDPELRKLAEKLQKANEIYAASKKVTEELRREIESLNKRIGELLRAKRADAEEVERLKERLAVLISKMQEQS